MRKSLAAVALLVTFGTVGVSGATEGDPSPPVDAPRIDAPVVAQGWVLLPYIIELAPGNTCGG